MYPIRTYCFAIASILMPTWNCFAQQPLPPNPQIKALQDATAFSPELCQLIAENELLKIEGRRAASYAPITACIEKAKIEARECFRPALEQVHSQPDSARLLKDFYAAWIVAIDSTMPSYDGGTRVYKSQMATSQAKAKELWSRFKIEAGQ